jgi:FkbM family methyltransferase
LEGDFVNWKKVVSSRFPWLVALKREAVAGRDLMLKRGGSQCGEDSWAISWLEQQGINFADVRYIEVGANQPTQLSNTWQFYLRGAQGLLVEPDPRCTSMLRRWRTRDVVLEALAGRHEGIELLHLHKHTTMNSPIASGEDTIGTMLVPIFTLDTMWDKVSQCLGWSHCHFLSIDTEGFEMEVLEGAKNTILRTMLICVEHFGSHDAKSKFQSLFAHTHQIAHETVLNLIFSPKAA